MRVLVIASDLTMMRNIELMLRAANFNVYMTESSEEGIEVAKVYDHDLILLDLASSDMNRFEALKTMRRAGVSAPVLIVSGNVTVETKVKAFACGADDYLVKPFHKDEFIARINAVVRRSKGHAQSAITTGRLTVNLDAKTVEIDGIPVSVTSKEYQLLELFSLRKGATLTKETFLNYLYGGLDEPEGKIIDVFICKLRKKLATASKGDHFIETVWGRGHTLRDPQDRMAA